MAQGWQKTAQGRIASHSDVVDPQILGTYTYARRDPSKNKESETISFNHLGFAHGLILQSNSNTA